MKKGYLSQLVKVDAADDIKPEPIMLKRAPRTLREATVTATKVMMVMKGDTIVYNADALSWQKALCSINSYHVCLA